MKTETLHNDLLEMLFDLSEVMTLVIANRKDLLITTDQITNDNIQDEIEMYIINLMDYFVQNISIRDTLINRLQSFGVKQDCNLDLLCEFLKRLPGNYSRESLLSQWISFRDQKRNKYVIPEGIWRPYTIDEVIFCVDQYPFAGYDDSGKAISLAHKAKKDRSRIEIIIDICYILNISLKHTVNIDQSKNYDSSLINKGCTEHTKENLNTTENLLLITPFINFIVNCLNDHYEMNLQNQYKSIDTLIVL